MEVREKGIFSVSQVEFVLPSSLARESLNYLTGWGRFFCSGELDFKYLRPEFQCLICVLDGRMKVRVSGVSRYASKGQVILVTGGERFAFECREKSEILWIQMGGATLHSYGQFLQKKNGGAIFHPADAGKFRDTVDAIIAQVSELNRNEHKISLLISDIYEQLSECRTAEESEIDFEGIMNYMRNHYQENLTLDQLAAFCGLSKSYLIRAFKKETGSTPHEYLLNYRLQKAMEMLRGSERSIEEISVQCGFNSTSHFARAFKKEIDVTPSDFRRMHY